MRKGWQEWADDGFPLLTPEKSGQVQVYGARYR